jgi:hypothetical protein
MTTKLAELLRQAAEKLPDKFIMSHALGCEAILILDGGGFELQGLDEPSNLTLDHMDAIAGAVGMEFEVGRMGRGDWVYFIFSGDRAIRIAESGDGYKTKRSASIAALIACLEYTLGKEREHA